MNPQVKAKWIAALRSGEYKQGKNTLRRGNEYCCLGVLCDIHSKETGHKWDGRAYHDASSVLPLPVRLWADCDSDPMVDDDYLTSINDGGWSFSSIADLIEKHL